MKDPWFTHDEVIKTYDLYFCKEARKIGYKIHVDLSCPSGHMVIATIWPKRIGTDWKTAIVVNNSVELIIPPAIRDGRGNLIIAEGPIEGRAING